MLSARELISKTNIIVLSVVLLVLFVVGSIWDFQISTVLFDPSNFLAKVGVAYGAIPAFIAWTASGTLLVLGRNREKLFLGFLQCSIGVLLIGISVGESILIPMEYMDIPLLISVCIGLILTGITSFLVAIVSRGADRMMMIRLAFIFFFVVVVELMMVNGIKMIWERPRMQLLEIAPDMEFQPWWVIGHPDKELMTSSGISGDDFKSLPSAHTSNAAVLMLITGMAALKTGLQKYTSWLLWAAVIFAAFVAISRIVIGAHFVTDTVLGFTVTFCVILIIYKFAFPLSGNIYDKNQSNREISSI